MIGFKYPSKVVLEIGESVDLVFINVCGIFPTWDSVAHILSRTHALKWPKLQVWPIIAFGMSFAQSDFL